MTPNNFLCRWFGHRWYDTYLGVHSPGSTLAVSDCKRCGMGAAGPREKRRTK